LTKENYFLSKRHRSNQRESDLSTQILFFYQNLHNDMAFRTYIHRRGLSLCHLCFTNFGTSPSEPPHVCFPLVPSGLGAGRLRITAGVFGWPCGVGVEFLWIQFYPTSANSKGLNCRDNTYHPPMNISHPIRTLAAPAHCLYIVCQIETPHEYLVVPQWRPPQLSYHLSIIHVLLSESNRL
jgi:hypothetical protein